MGHVLRQRVTIQPGGKIELQSPELRAGEEAEVIVSVLPSAKRDISPLSLVGSGKGLYKTADEVDAYLNKERDSWEK
jgi:hypothetical protein